jgi:putative IMPACT (imprinted ancient) family translation regulator
MQHSYTTIKSEVRDILLKEKGSKFIGFAFPVNNEKELKTALDNLEKNIQKLHIIVMLSE